MVGEEPVPAASWVSPIGLLGVGDRESVAIGLLVHPCPARQIFGRLRAAVEHHEQRRAGSCAESRRNVEAVRCAAVRAGVGQALPYPSAARPRVQRVVCARSKRSRVDAWFASRTFGVGRWRNGRRNGGQIALDDRLVGGVKLAPVDEVSHGLGYISSDLEESSPCLEPDVIAVHQLNAWQIRRDQPRISAHVPEAAVDAE